MKKYWFYLFADTFVWTKGKNGIVYNAKNGASFLFEYAEPLKTRVDELNRIESLYRISVVENDMMTTEIKSFVKNVIRIAAGELVPESHDFKRPISYKPELRVRDDASFYKWRHNNGISGNVIDNLNELLFYINGSIHGSDQYYKQVVFPLKNAEMLDQNRIIDFVKKCKKSTFLSEISLVGNIWEYPAYDNLISSLLGLGYGVIVYCLIGDILANKERAGLLVKEGKNTTFRILVDNYGKASDFFRDCNLARITSICYTFFCKNEDEYGEAVELIDKYNLKSEIIPLYVTGSVDFFENYVYATEEEILNSNLSRREVFAHQGLNTNSFGKLYIMPNGQIYANCNNPTIGAINDLPYEVVYRELINGCSWLSIRNEAPCSDCIYQWLCPSPSNYEKVIGRPNLCHIK